MILTKVDRSIRSQMKNTLTAIGNTLLAFALVDILILTFALAQLAIEGRTGEWSEFWLMQARFLINLVG